MASSASFVTNLVANGLKKRETPTVFSLGWKVQAIQHSSNTGLGQAMLQGPFRFLGNLLKDWMNGLTDRTGRMRGSSMQREQYLFLDPLIDIAKGHLCCIPQQTPSSIRPRLSADQPGSP
jgi:hypothetical protein